MVLLLLFLFCHETENIWQLLLSKDQFCTEYRKAIILVVQKGNTCCTSFLVRETNVLGYVAYITLQIIRSSSFSVVIVACATGLIC